MSAAPLMQVRGATRRFTVGAGLFAKRRTLHAVNGVDLDIARGEVLAIVGESGCGKSTLARMLLGLLAPSEGRVTLEGTDLRDIPRKAFARRVQPVFQDPYASLNPRQRVADIVALPLRAQGTWSRAQCRDRARAMLERVGLGERHADAFPGQLSGGQRQRVAIARALAVEPELVICDEPTSALDVSVQAQILNLLLALREDGRRTYVFISHNLAVVEHIATRVAVMYLGRVVELADTATLFAAPRHPYTRALLASALPAVPGHGIPDTGLGLAYPDPLNPPTGCAFHPRCASARPECAQRAPDPIDDATGRIACHLYPAGTNA
jgi:peptide/nickel transport system ATP-binding protein